MSPSTDAMEVIGIFHHWSIEYECQRSSLSNSEVDFMDRKIESSNRFYRNHSLMLELFSDTRVPTDGQHVSDYEQSELELESQIAEAQSSMVEMNNDHVNRLLGIIQKNQEFANVMQLANEKLQNLIESSPPKTCDETNSMF